MTDSISDLDPRTRWGPILLLSLAVGLAFFLNLGGAPLFDRDEGAFSEATREMVESGNYITTTLNGEPRYDKPVFDLLRPVAGWPFSGGRDWASAPFGPGGGALGFRSFGGSPARNGEQRVGWPGS